MPSLTPKKIGGHTYYYARYCQRVDGKPKIVRQVYLGQIGQLGAAAEPSQQPPQPLETEVAAFADSAALFDIAQRLDLVPLLDSILPAKRHQGLSIGQYLLLAAINRAVSPTSKVQFADWDRQTVLTRLRPADPAALSSQSFWNHMDLVTAEHVLECEKQITQRQVRLGLLVSADYHIPLFHKVYAGTANTSTESRSITEDLSSHYRQLAES